MASALIHEKSHECLKGELDIFEAPPTQTSLVSGSVIEVLPISSVQDNTGPIEFQISGTGDEYIDLANTTLHIVARIEDSKGQVPSDAKDKCGPVNYWLHSLFSQIEVTLQGKTVGHLNTLYPYRAMIETLFYYSPEAASHGHLQMAMFAKDTAGKMDDRHPELEQNKGLHTRFQFCKDGQWVEMMGPLHLDIFQQDKYLLNNVSIGIKLLRSRPEFCLMTTATLGNSEKYTVKIQKAVLNVRKVKVADHVYLAHASTLYGSNAIYPINGVVMKAFSIPSGNLVGPADNIFLGQLPIEIAVAFVKSSALNGEYSSNPFNFENMKLKYIAAKYNGVQYPSKDYQPAFEESKSGGGSFLQCYDTVFTGTGKLYGNRGSIINRYDFPRGYAVYVFDFRPDLGSRGHYSLRQNGALQIDVQFAEQLQQTITMIVYAVFDSYFEITHMREVIPASFATY